MSKRKLPFISTYRRVRKLKSKSLIIPGLVTLLVVAGAAIAIASQGHEANQQSVTPSNGSISSQQTSPSVDIPKEQTVSPNASSTATPKPAYQTSPQPSQTEPATLAGCTYENGSKAGQACPATAPPSYSQNGTCAYSNPSFGSTYCRPYNMTVVIRGYYDSSSGKSYCMFEAQPGSLKSYNQVEVSNASNPGGAPDCSIDSAL